MGRLRAVLVLGLMAACLGAGEVKPVGEGEAGRRAFEALGKRYAVEVEKGLPLEDEAVAGLEERTAEGRAKAGAYVLALLKQSQADESNGRAGWKRLPYFGGGSESAAREFRKGLAVKLGNGPAVEEALDAAMWLAESDRLAQDADAGVQLLARIDSPRIGEAYKRLLSPAHPMTSVAAAAAEDAGKRGLKELGPIAAGLRDEPRKAVREAARKAAGLLGVADAGVFDPEKAVGPGSYVEGELQGIAGMVLPAVGKDAKWGLFEVTEPVGSFFGNPGDDPPPDRKRMVKGWLIGEDKDFFKMVDLFGEEQRLEKKRATFTEGKLGDEVAGLLAERQPKAGEDRFENGLSRRGGLTGQFEARFVSVPEGLAAAWLLERGDRKGAAAIILPRFDAAEDERWVSEAVADMLAQAYQDEMLKAFTSSRDYAEAGRIAAHLGKKQFEHWQYFERTKELGAQLAKRGEDFKTLTLPTAEEWKALKEKLPRAEQVAYLCKRIRLLNAFQWGQPGSVDFGMQQWREPAELLRDGKAAVEVIHPVEELYGLKLEVKDIPAMLVFLDDDDFVLAYGYWRDFHPDRYLYRVSGFVASAIDDAACRELIDGGAYEEADGAGKQAMRDAAMKWVEANKGKSRTELLLKSLTEGKTFEAIAPAAKELAEMKEAGAVAVLVKRMEDFGEDSQRALLAECCFEAGADKCVAAAREWVKTHGEVRFWGAMVLYKAGDRATNEGYAKLKESLDADGEELPLFRKAFGPLMVDGRKEAADLAASVAAKLKWQGNFDFDTNYFVGRLLANGRQEGVDFVAGLLADETVDGKGSAKVDGKKVEFDLTRGDRAAEWFGEFRSDDYHYPIDEVSAEKRKAEREKLVSWLKEQAALARAGKPTALRGRNYQVERLSGVDAPGFPLKRE